MSRRVLRRAAACLGPLALVGLSAMPGAAAAATHTVLTRSTNVFDPKSLTIAPGDQVTWGNPANGSGGVNHTVTATSDNWEFDQPLAIPGQTASYTFEKAGTYNYVCETHGPAMSGSVVVRAASTTSPRPSPRPSPTRTSSPRPSPTRTSDPTPDPTPSASASSVGTPPLGNGSPSPATASPGSEPSIAPADPTPTASASSLVYGGRGVTPSPASGREWGLPVMLAVLSIVGVAAAEARTIRASSSDDRF